MSESSVGKAAVHGCGSLSRGRTNGFPARMGAEKPNPKRMIAFGGARLNVIARSKIEYGNSLSRAQAGKPREATDLRPTELDFAGGARIAVGEE